MQITIRNHLLLRLLGFHPVTPDSAAFVGLSLRMWLRVIRVATSFDCLILADGGISTFSGGFSGVALADPANQVSLRDGPRTPVLAIKDRQEEQASAPKSDDELIAAYLATHVPTKCPTAFAAASDGYAATVESDEVRAHRFKFKGNGGRGKAGGAILGPRTTQARKRMVLKRAPRYATK